MKIEETALPGLVVLTPARHGDSRGWFTESWSAAAMAELGLEIGFVQDNHSFSAAEGTLRGMHCQFPPHAQDKLVRCTRGAIFDVAVDARRGSPTYGRWAGVDVTAENGRQLLVPKGFLHGFVTRLPDTEVQYKCSAVYAPALDHGIRWDDPDLAIDWGLSAPPLVSAKDREAADFAGFVSPFAWEDGAW